MDVKGKVAIVTGSATGVGRETALALAGRGCGVVVNYTRSEAEAKETLAAVEALGVPALLCKCDVSDDAAVRAMAAETVAKLGGVDVLVNNAGATTFVDHADLEGLTEEIWDTALAVNLKGAFFCARAVAAPMRARGGGVIVNVSSIAGVNGGGSSIAYGAAKAGVNNMTINLARVLGPEIRVNAVAPGFIDTRWWREGSPATYERVRERLERTTALKRVTTAEDVAQLIVALITSADLVTGQTLVIDGGTR